jgi:hypothetical protein
MNNKKTDHWIKGPTHGRYAVWISSNKFDVVDHIVKNYVALWIENFLFFRYRGTYRCAFCHLFESITLMIFLGQRPLSLWNWVLSIELNRVEVTLVGRVLCFNDCLKYVLCRVRKDFECLESLGMQVLFRQIPHTLEVLNSLINNKLSWYLGGD